VSDPLRLEVDWLDSGAQHTAGWNSKEEILDILKIGKVTTVGLLFHETEDTLYVALSYDPDNENYFGVQAIAKQNILSRRILRAR